MVLLVRIAYLEGDKINVKAMYEEKREREKERKRERERERKREREKERKKERGKERKSLLSSKL